MANKVSKKKKRESATDTNNQQPISHSNDHKRTLESISKQQRKEIEFVWYYPSFTNTKSKTTLYKLDLSSLEKIISHSTRTNKVIWINDLTIMINNYYNPFQLPTKQTINVPKTKTGNELKAMIVNQLNIDVSFEEVYVFGHDAIGYAQELDNELLIDAIDERFTLLVLYNVKAHSLLNNYKSKESNIVTELVSVSISEYCIPLKVMLPYKYYAVSIKNSDVRIILFDLIDPYLRDNYSGCDDKDLPFEMNASLAIKMRNNQRSIPRNDELIYQQTFGFTLKFDGNVVNYCVLPDFEAKRPKHVLPKRQRTANSNENNTTANNSNLRRKLNVNRVESNCIMDNELNVELNDSCYMEMNCELSQKINAYSD